MELLFYNSDSDYEELNLDKKSHEKSDQKFAQITTKVRVNDEEKASDSKIDYKFLRKQGINVRRYKSKDKLKVCEINIKKLIETRNRKHEELNELNLQRKEQIYRCEIVHGCVNWISLKNERLLFGFVVVEDSLPSRHGIHRFRMMVDEIFVKDSCEFPIPPSIHTCSVLESVKFDLDFLGIIYDTFICGYQLLRI